VLELEKVKRCCGVKLKRCTKGFGHIIERYECAKCGDMYQPFTSTLSLREGIRYIKYIDAKVADCLEGEITWIREEKECQN